MVEYSASTARTLCGHVFRDWFGFPLDYSRNRSTREYSIRPMDFLYATAPMPAGTSLASKWRSSILSLILQRRRQNAIHSKDLCEYRHPRPVPPPPIHRNSIPGLTCPFKVNQSKPSPIMHPIGLALACPSPSCDHSRVSLYPVHAVALPARGRGSKPSPAAQESGETLG